MIVSRHGLAIIIFLVAAMLGLTYALIPPVAIEGRLGICLPSPNEWNLHFPASWLLNSAAILLCVFALVFSNRKFNFLQSTDNVLPAILLMMIGCNPLITRGFCSSTLILAVNLVCMNILFDTYRKSNASQENFVVATLLSLGSMVEYAFVPLTLAYMAGGFMMKSFRLRETLAYLFGLVAPYWVGIGMGILPLENFQMPQFSNLFENFSAKDDLFIVVISLGFTILLGFVLSLRNALRLYSGNSRIRALNNVINAVGCVCAVCIAVDFTNMLAYTGTLYVWAALQVANLYALDRHTTTRLWIWLISGIYVAFYIAAMLS